MFIKTNTQKWVEKYKNMSAEDRDGAYRHLVVTGFEGQMGTLLVLNLVAGKGFNKGLLSKYV